MSFHVTNRWQFGRNCHKIPWLFHVIYPGFTCFPCKTMIWILERSIHGIFMTFSKKMMGFPSDLMLFSTKLPLKKIWENPCQIVLREALILAVFLLTNWSSKANVSSSSFPAFRLSNNEIWVSRSKTMDRSWISSLSSESFSSKDV